MSRNSVFLNPKFKNIHINPKFIQPTSDVEARVHKIHINPNFIPKIEQNVNSPNDLEKPLLCTRSKLIRQTKTVEPRAKTSHVTSLKKIGLRKLVRPNVAHKPGVPVPASPFTPSSPSSSRTDRVSKFKVVRRTSVPEVDLRPKVVSSRFRLKRGSFSDVLTPRKVSVSRYRLRRIGSSKKESPKGSQKLFNINGVLYKSSRSQLFKSPVRAAPSSPSGNALYIRGEKFLVTGNGNRLQRAPESPAISEPRKRLDIGGVTFVANDKGGFERTNSHMVRSYLSHAKQRSLNTLTQQFRKNNIPCMIYRRLGKCLSHERGKCNKKHDPDQVAVCKKFLRGQCTKLDCLLSHRACMEKMPTCRYFLDGCCTTIDCQYLHKKVSKGVDVCPEFQRGFCPLAEKCTKRHEFAKEEGKRVLKRPYNKKKKEQSIAEADVETEQRYYGLAGKNKEKVVSSEPADGGGAEKSASQSEDEDDGAIVTKRRRRRPPIGTLPAFIPL